LINIQTETNEVKLNTLKKSLKQLLSKWLVFLKTSHAEAVRRDWL